MSVALYTKRQGGDREVLAYKINTQGKCLGGFGSPGPFPIDKEVIEWKDAIYIYIYYIYILYDTGKLSQAALRHAAAQLTLGGPQDDT